METVTFPEKLTFDSSCTPKRGEKKSTAALRPLDLGKLKERLGTVEAETKANDPIILRKRVAELEAAVRKAPAADAIAIQAAEARGREIGERESAHVWFRRGVEAVVGQIGKSFDTPFIHRELAQWEGLGALAATAAPVPSVLQNRRGEPAPHSARARSAPPAGSESPLDQRILDALARLSAIKVDPAARSILAAMVGYSNFKSGTFASAVARTIADGLVMTPRPGYVSLTSGGAARANHPSARLTTDEIQRAVVDILGSPADKILAKLIEVYPNAITRADLGAAAGYSNYKSGTFASAAAKLIDMGFALVPFVGSVRATEVLFP